MKEKSTLILLLTIFTIITSLLILYVENKSMTMNLLVNKEVNLGKVGLNSKREFEISLTNPTKKDFTISKSYTSCGCTKVVGETLFSIKQGETANIKVEFDPSSMHQIGDSIDHEVYFLVTSPIEKEYKVKITGKVI